MGQIDVGSLLHHQHDGGGLGLFSRLLQVRLHQGRKADIRLIEQTIQGFGLFPGLHLSRQGTQRIFRQLAGCLNRSCASTQLLQLDTPKGVLGPVLGIQYFLCVHPLFYHFVKCG